MNVLVTFNPLRRCRSRRTATR